MIDADATIEDAIKTRPTLRMKLETRFLFFVFFRTEICQFFMRILDYF